jgi:hypothetical protein
VPRDLTEFLVVACSAVLALGLLGGLGSGTHRPSLSPARASWRLTPGVANPEVTQATIRQTICKSGWTKTIRPPSSYTSALEAEQMKIYRRSGSPADYQEDHLISLELGGDPADPRNLWPEPIAIAEDVDQVEDDLNRKICTGEITLAEGQRRISELKHTSG